MIVKSFEFNMFGENTYIVYDPETKDAAVIDPGMMNRRECEVLFRFIADNRLNLVHIILTHLHVDHVMGVNAVKGKYEVESSAHQADEFLGKRIQEQIQMFHLPMQMGNIHIDKYLSDGQKIRIGNGELTVLSVPGHSPGGIALYSPKDGFVITGDALFKGSIGRTDLPGGDYATLINAISSKLITLPDSTVVYPGHGPATTVGNEKKMNPYL